MLAVLPAPSVTVIVAVEVSVAVGTPLITPSLLMLSPDGKPVALQL